MAKTYNDYRNDGYTEFYAGIPRTDKTSWQALARADGWDQAKQENLQQNAVYAAEESAFPAELHKLAVKAARAEAKARLKIGKRGITCLQCVSMCAFCRISP